MNRYSLMDLFAGCGGMTRGFEDTGRFRAIFAVEWDTDAAETYRRNFGDHVVEGAIEEVPSFPDVDVVIGGPPLPGVLAIEHGGRGTRTSIAVARIPAGVGGR